MAAASARPAPARAEVTGVTARPPALAGQARQAADPAASYQRAFPGRADQLAQVRRAIAGYLDGCGAYGEHRLRTPRPPRLGPGRSQAHRGRRSRRPGDKLPAQAQITAELGISETTTRRACRELGRLGLIRLVPGHGYYPGTLP
jgi:regulatory GntR family protein